jgi:hypothetical protein
MYKCSRKQFVVAKNCSGMDLAEDLAGDVGAFFILLKHRSNFFPAK